MQFFGSRGADVGGGDRPPTSAGGDIKELDSKELISMRSQKQEEVDQVLTVSRDINNKYGETAYEFNVVTLEKGESTIAYYTYGADILSFNDIYFDSKKMDKAYDEDVAQGFHPPRGKRTGVEAVIAHEMGHKLSFDAMRHMGLNSMDKAADKILSEAKKSIGMSQSTGIGRKISGYGGKNTHEAIAEAYSDVYCNGRGASKYSKAVVKALESHLKKKRG